MKFESNIDYDNNDITLPCKNLLREKFEKYSEISHNVVNDLKEQIEKILTPLNSSPVVSCRNKNFSSYYSKYIRMLKSGVKNPEIMDLMGIRIICPFIEDVSDAENLINKNFKVIESEKKGHFSYKEFGYESTHIIILIPQEITDKHGYPGTNTLEIQVRTILQNAWAEVEHELVYKAAFSVFDEPMKRKLASINASLSLADIVFQEIRSHQRNYTRELDKRRESFYKKVEEVTDDLLFNEINAERDDRQFYDKDDIKSDNTSLDDLLLNALTYHNQNRFNDAISQYSKIIDLKPNNKICSIIYKHRGMAYFACSQYKEAITDFTQSYDLDNESYKALYYRGVVRSVLRQYSLAIDDFSLAISINPYNSFVFFRRGQAYYHIGDFPHALADCENSLNLEPSSEPVLRFKELLLQKLKM